MTKFDKKQIQQRFDSSNLTYEQSANIQKECSKILINMLFKHFPHFSPKTILDLGTGTGFIPELLISLLPNSHYTLNDISPQMINMVKKKFASYSQFQFLLGDMESIDLTFHELIISNFALQWTEQLKDIIKKCYANSQFFAFTCLLENTFQEWTKILNYKEIASSSFPYPSEIQLNEIIASLKPINFISNIIDIELCFENAKSFMQYLQNLGASYSLNKIPFNKLKNLIKTHNDKFNVTYKVFFGLLGKI